ncbi:hypothetical protein BKH22_13000 [Actinomyces oris]|nr:hypothetical protein BKH22_13000 [Actinomyces oris]
MNDTFKRISLLERDASSVDTSLRLEVLESISKCQQKCVVIVQTYGFITPVTVYIIVMRSREYRVK